MSKQRKSRKGLSDREKRRRFLQRHRDKLTRISQPRPVDRHLIEDIDRELAELRRNPVYGKKR